MIDPKSLDLSSLPWVPLKATNGFPEDPAIYFAIDSQGTVQYVGRTINVRARWKNHHRYAALEQIGGVKISYLFVDTPELLPSIESALIAWFRPPLNVAGKKSLPPAPAKHHKLDLLQSKPLEPIDFCRRWVQKDPDERGWFTACVRELAEVTRLSERSVERWGRDFQDRPSYVLQLLRNEDIIRQVIVLVNPEELEGLSD